MGSYISFEIRICRKLKLVNALDTIKVLNF